MEAWKGLKLDFKQFDWYYKNHTSDCTPIHPSNSIIKFADDTAVVGLRVCRECSGPWSEPDTAAAIRETVQLAEMQGQQILKQLSSLDNVMF